MSTIAASTPSPTAALHGWLLADASTTRSANVGGFGLIARVLAALAALVMASVLLTGGLADVADADAVAGAPVSVVVQPGDTVWAIARTHAPEGVTTQDYMLQVVEFNDADATQLRPGSVLRLP